MNNTPCRHAVAIASEPDGLALGYQCMIGRSAPSECHGCAAYDPRPDDADRTVCEVWSRVMGYHRPVSAYNHGKQQEHRDRVAFLEPH